MAAESMSPSLSMESLNFLSSPQVKIIIKHTYHFLISYALYILFIPAILSAALIHVDQITVSHLYNHANHNGFTVIIVMFSMYLVIMFLRPKKVYLVDFACYKHDPSYLTSRETVKETLSRFLSPESYEFSAKVMERSGVNDKVFIYGANDFPPPSSFACAREEAEVVICGAVDHLLTKTGVHSRDIGVVIVNNSTFNPVPSLSAMIVNRYRLKEDVLSYNLGGMGCSAGLIAIDLAKRLLQVQRNTYALIMSLECPTSNYYLGNEKSKLLSNCLFRMGGAAVLLSNRSFHRRNSKYELKHTLRTHLGANDRAYKCVLQEPDKEGHLGMTISKDLVATAGEALKANITTLAPLVLPMSEQLLFLATLIARKLFKLKGVPPYMPNFKLAFKHFCIHAGGKAVLDEVEKNLKLTKWDMEPSRMTLYRYSNTSSSSLWYELAYAEAKGRIKKGDRVWQIGFGSGFKCGSGVWTALRTINPDQVDNPWVDVIDQFSVNLASP